MWIILVDLAGNYLRDAGTLAGSELHHDNKGIVYRRTGTYGAASEVGKPPVLSAIPANGKPIFKQV